MTTEHNNGQWKTDEWFVSPWNYQSEVIQGFEFQEPIRFHDVSLRDGEQQVGITLSRKQKVEIARRLSDVGIHRIEAGLPAVSPEDEAAIKEIVQLGLPAEIFCFSRGILSDVKKAKECGVHGVVIEIPSSEHIIKYGYGWTVQKAFDLAVEATQFAKQAGLHTVFFPVDGSRAQLGWFLDHIERIASEGHMDSLTVADTFGVCSSHAIPIIIRKIRERIAKPLEAHFHNDFGQATANTLQALAAGASVAHTTVAGIGERSGNAAYEEVALALKTLYGKECGLKLDKMYGLARHMGDVCRIPIANNRPVIGSRLFTFESGLVVGIWRRCREDHLLEIVPYVPGLVGQSPIQVILGKKSGMASIEEWLDKLSIRLTEEKKERLLAAVKKLATEKNEAVTEVEFKALVVDQTLRSTD